MNLQYASALAGVTLEALLRYKLRTALSILGVVLGVGAVTVMVAVGSGAREEALRQIDLIGLDNVIVRHHDVGTDNRDRHRSTGLTMADAERLRQLVPRVAVGPVVERYATIEVAGLRMETVALGVKAVYGNIVGLHATAGRLLGAADDYGTNRVCVLGATLDRQLFAKASAIGSSIQLNGDSFRIVGVLSDRSSPREVAAIVPNDLNSSVLVPIGALVGHSVIGDPALRLQEVWLHASSGRDVPNVVTASDRILARAHYGVDDYSMIVPRQLLEQRQRTQAVFNIVVGSIAAIALLVGGIGIMNIMLASVLERTNEIGLRRSAGATKRDIAGQFLIESVVMSISGGVIGMGAGVAGAMGTSRYAGWPTHLSASVIVIGVAVSSATGILFGTYPAIRAASMQPIDALRHD